MTASRVFLRHRSLFGAKSFVVFDLHGFLLFLNNHPLNRKFSSDSLDVIVRFRYP